MDIDEFIEKHERTIFRYCLSLCSRRELAEELTQETFLKVMANVPLLSLRTDGERLAWTFTVAKNITFDMLRAQRREFAYERENVDLEIESALLQEPTIDAKLESLLQGFSREMREVLQMKFELGMNSREIAKKLSTPEGTVRRRIQIGLSKIKNNIRE